MADKILCRLIIADDIEETALLTEEDIQKVIEDINGVLQMEHLITLTNGETIDTGIIDSICSIDDITTESNYKCVNCVNADSVYFYRNMHGFKCKLSNKVSEVIIDDKRIAVTMCPQQ